MPGTVEAVTDQRVDVAAFSYEGDAPNAVVFGGQVEVTTDPIHDYLKIIGKTPLLNAEQEVDLAKKIEAGLYAGAVLAGQVERPEGGEIVDPALLGAVRGEGEDAKDHFIRANLRLVVSIAKRYVRSGMPMLDLIQEGNAGLIRAVEKFDYQRGYKMSTYATWWIRQAITRGIAQQGHTIRKPVQVVEQMNKVKRATDDFLKAFGYEPDVEELSAATGFDEVRVAELQSFIAEPSSLDATVGPDQGTSGAADMHRFVADSAPGPEEQAIVAEENAMLAHFLSFLDHRSLAVIRARMGLEDGRVQTLVEVGERLGISRERVRQIEVEALTTLRRLAEVSGLEAA